jgi:alpha-maltose-1-phosphate synthase
MEPAARAQRRVLVHHPGSNHLAYELVSSLQRGGYDTTFETGFFYTESGAAARLTSLLPAGPRARIQRELRRRSHKDVDPAKLRFHPLPEIAYVALNRLGFDQDRLNRIIGWRNDIVDARVAARVRRERPDFVVGHDSSALLAQRAAREVGTTSVLSQVIGHIAQGIKVFQEEIALAPEFAESLTLPPEYIVERCTQEVLEADSILCSSDYVRDTLLARGADPARAVVVPYGVDVNRFRPGRKRTSDTFRMLFVGSLSQRKGIKYLLEAVRRLNLPHAELLLVGKMVANPDALKPYAGLFRHVPHVPYHEVHALYQDADIFVYPSLHEGSAFATYEALASGLPVVATAETGSVVRDGEDGFIVKMRDVEGLMSRIEQLYRDPALRASMAVNARARAEQFTWAHYRQRILAQFDALSARRS